MELHKAVSEYKDYEKRVVDKETGGEKCKKMTRFSLIPPRFLWELADHFEVGAMKYDDHNWKKGYKWSLSYDALQRHIHEWAMGESRDTDTKSHHLIAAAWHCICLWWFENNKKGTDDIRES